MKFKIIQLGDYRFYFEILLPDQRILCTSERYVTKEECMNAIDAIRLMARNAKVEEPVALAVSA